MEATMETQSSPVAEAAETQIWECENPDCGAVCLDNAGPMYQCGGCDQFTGVKRRCAECNRNCRKTNFVVCSTCEAGKAMPVILPGDAVIIGGDNEAPGPDDFAVRSDGAPEFVHTGDEELDGATPVPYDLGIIGPPAPQPGEARWGASEEEGSPGYPDSYLARIAAGEPVMAAAETGWTFHASRNQWPLPAVAPRHRVFDGDRRGHRAHLCPSV